MGPSPKRESLFFDCILAIEEADINQDDRLSKQEAAIFFTSFYQLLLADKASAIMAPSTGDMTTDVEKMYPGLVKLSEPPKGVTEIDVYGASVMELPMAAEPRLKALRAVCEAVEHGFLVNFVSAEKARCAGQWAALGLDPDECAALVKPHSIDFPYKMCDYHFYKKAEQQLAYDAARVQGCILAHYFSFQLSG